MLATQATKPVMLLTARKLKCPAGWKCRPFRTLDRRRALRERKNILKTGNFFQKRTEQQGPSFPVRLPADSLLGQHDF
jgi:hypothetical protein